MIPQSTIAGWVLFGYAVASLLWSPTSPWLAAVQLVSLAGAFWLGAQVYRGAKYCALIALCLSIPFTVAWQVFGINPNIAGCFFVLFLSIAMAYRQWYPCTAYAMLLGLTQSRGAILAGGMVTFVYVVRKAPLIAVGVFAFVLASVAYIKPGLSESVVFRMGIWQDTINHLVPFGHGLGSFSVFMDQLVYRTGGHYTLYGAYNDYLQLNFELGIGSIPLFWLIATALFADHKSRLVLFAVLACGLSFYALFIPGLAHAFAFVLGHLQRSEYHGKMETCGSALPSGAGR